MAKPDSVARNMASAPLPASSPVFETAAQPIKAENHTPFEVSSFKPYPKPTEYTNDDGSKSKRIGTAVLRITGTPIMFNASISLRTSIVKGAAGNQEQKTVVCSLPTTGKGFPRPVFETDDPTMTAALIHFRNDVARDFLSWRKNLTPTQRATVASGDSIGVEYAE